MTFDWTVTLGSIVGAIITILGFVVSLLIAHYAMQRETDNRFSEVILTVDNRFSVLNLRLEKIFEGDIRELRNHTIALDERCDAIMKEVVERSHTVNNHVNTLILKVDRLERPIKNDT